MNFTFHSLISYTHHDIVPHHRCAITWDLRQHPDYAHRVPDPYFPAQPPLELNHYATTPPLKKMHIVCGILPEYWPIRVVRDDGIRVGDVLHAISSVLQKRLTKDEYDRLSIPQRQRVSLQFEERCNLEPNAQARAACHANGALRVDTLLNHVYFGGLSVSPDLDKTGVLTLGRPRR